MAKFIRKIDSRTWLTNPSLVDRVRKAVGAFNDRGGKPSVYAGDSPEDRILAVSALAWNRRRGIEKIEKTDYVIITDEQIVEAGLTLVATKSTIEWTALENRHFEITRDGSTCTEEDLRRLVEILIRDKAEHGRFAKEELKEEARKHCENM